MSFSNIIDKKLVELRSLESRLKNSVVNHEYHTEKVRNAMATVIADFDSLENLTADQIKVEAKSILLQIAPFVESVWTSLISDIKITESDIRKWEEMKLMHDQWESAEGARKLKEELLKEKIANDEIKEPSKMTSVRRPRGVKPEISLSKYRMLSDEIDDGEDQ